MRKRRTLSDIKALRSQVLNTVRVKGEVTLSELVSDFGLEIGVRDTPSDRNLVRKQLECLAELGTVDLGKAGRNLVVRAPDGLGGESDASDSQQLSRRAQLAAVKAYAAQMEEFAKTLQDQIRALVRMVERIDRR